MSVGSAILFAAMIAQLAAAAVAVWLIRVTGRKWGWILLAAALVLMVVRRVLALHNHYLAFPDFALDPRNEALALVVSLVMLAGLLCIVPMFRGFAHMAGELREAQSSLEQRVRKRTAELAAANEGLQQERYLLHTLMNYLPHNIYFKDQNSRFIRVNTAMSRYFRLGDPSEAIGKGDNDFFTDEHASQALADEQEIVRTGRGIIDKEEKETWPDGHSTWASTTKLPLYDDQGQIVGTFGISQDVTVQKRNAEALQAAKEAAEAASRAKSTFLANMSHEIRTPLNAVIGMTELVLKSQLTPQQRDYLSTVRDSGEALLSVINDILDFSKIDAEKLVIERAPFHLRESLGDTMKSFAIRAHQQGLELACQIHTDVPARVVGDYHRLRQVIVNLVNNAIKFTERGEVVLEVSRESQCENCVTLHFIVSDSGIGIPPEKHKAIFGMFEQADSSTTRRHGGTGLGLAIASRLVGLMGGEIWLESDLGRGSRFHFTICLELDDSQPLSADVQEPPCLHGMRVLVVDDNATNRRILDEALASWSMIPTSVANAAEAFELMREADGAGRPFPLVITDAHMPDVDGFMLAGQIRKNQQPDGPVIMMITSGDRPCDLAECERLGISAYLLKPVKQLELLEAVELALGLTGPRLESVLAEPRRGKRRPLRILLAEDSLVNQQLALALLRGEGHEVVLANNGREAVAAVEMQRFDLVLMDVQMPDVDGLEATAAIRRAELQSGRHLPIIAMTAHALQGDRERCLAAGMDGYTPKPINAEELFATIEKLTGPLADAACREIVPDEDPVDWPEALKAVRGDEQLLTLIVETALAEIPELLAGIRKAVTGSDGPVLRRTAHTLRGSVRYFGARRVIELAERLEGMGQEANFHAAREALAPLGEASDRLLASLAARAARSHEPKILIAQEMAP